MYIYIEWNNTGKRAALLFSDAVQAVNAVYAALQTPGHLAEIEKQKSFQNCGPETGYFHNFEKGLVSISHDFGWLAWLFSHFATAANRADRTSCDALGSVGLQPKQRFV